MKGVSSFLFVCLGFFLLVCLSVCFVASSSASSPQALEVKTSCRSSHRWDTVMGREAAAALKSLLQWLC